MKTMKEKLEKTRRHIHALNEFTEANPGMLEYRLLRHKMQQLEKKENRLERRRLLMQPLRPLVALWEYLR